MKIRFKMVTAVAIICSACSMSVSEASFQITPTTYDTGTLSGTWVVGTNAWSGAGASNVGANDIEGTTGYAELFSQYKAVVGNAANPQTEETGPGAPYYATIFSNTPFDPENADIANNGNGFIDADQVYLVVMGGSGNTGWYNFDLTFLGWTGIETLELSGFWPGKDAISHVEIFAGGSGGPNFVTAVPEPAAMALWLTVAAGGAFARRRRLQVQA